MSNPGRQTRVYQLLNVLLQAAPSPSTPTTTTQPTLGQQSQPDSKYDTLTPAMTP
jgi:hypothetical protein